MKNRTSSTVLEKCEINTGIMKFLKKRGLVIPEEIKPFDKHLKSPSEEWFYSIADRFTPPLSEAEVKVYETVPHLLSLKIQKSAQLFSDVSILLQDALDEVDELKEDEERVAAILSILRVFHNCLDHVHLKHDRHLEYYDYRESPVGYYWWRFRSLIERAAERTEGVDTKEWVNQKTLEVLSGSRRPLLSTEYSICCSKVYAELKEKIQQVDTLPPEDIAKRVKRGSPKLFRTIEIYAEEFYRPLEGFVADCLASKGANLPERVARSKDVSKKAFEKVCSKLDDDEASEFGRLVEIIEDFQAAQEIEGAITTGLHAVANTYVYGILFEGHDRLRKLLLSNPEMIEPEHKEKVFALLEAEDQPSIFTADREFMVNAEKFFVEPVKKLYMEAIETWRSL